MKKAFLLGLFIPLMFTECKKDKPKAPVPAPTKTELLTRSQGWKLTSATSDTPIDFDGDGTKETDLYGKMQTCESDEIYTFKSNGTSTDDEGATKCDPNDPQTIDGGDWLFNPDETILTWDGDSYGILELTKTDMKLKITYTDTDGTTYNITATFK